MIACDCREAQFKEAMALVSDLDFAITYWLTPGITAPRGAFSAIQDRCRTLMDKEKAAARKETASEAAAESILCEVCNQERSRSVCYGNNFANCTAK